MSDSDSIVTIKQGPVAWMAGNKVASNLLMLLCIVGGLLAIPRLRQEVFPSFELDIVEVSVAYPGASPEEVEQGILLAVEEAVRGLDGVKRVTATASEGFGRASIELLERTDANVVLQDVKNAVDRITNFPEDAERPEISLTVPRREVLSVIVYGDLDEYTLLQQTQAVKERLLQEPQLTLVTIDGRRPLEISIEVPQQQLRAHGLTLEGIAAEVAKGSLELAGGGIKTAGGELLLRTAERRDFGTDFGDIPIVGTPDGASVRLRDLAEIKDGFADVDRQTTFDGLPAMRLAVYQTGKEDPISVAGVVRRVLEELRGELPGKVKLTVVADRSEIYSDRISLLLRNAMTGLVLVMVLLGLFLDVRLAFWVTMGIPISFLGSLFLMPFSGISINMVSLFAFIIAVGIVVDDAIVVGESIYHSRQQGMPYLQAAITGARLVSLPVVLAVLTNILAFLPLMALPGVSGQLWRNVPMVIILIFSVSLVECLFILPAHLAHQKPKPTGWLVRTLSWPQQHVGPALERFSEKVYFPLIRRTLRHRFIVLALGVAVLIATIGFVAGGRIGFTFFPKVESDVVRASAVLPYGSPFSETVAVKERIVQAARDVLAEHGGDAITLGIFADAGSAGRSFGPFGGGAASAGNLATITVYLVPLKQRDVTAAEFTEEWRQQVGEIPGLESIAFRFTIGPSSGKPIDVQISHPDVERMEAVAQEVAAALPTFAGVVEVDDGIARGKPQLDFRLKPAARALGLTAADIGRQVRNSFYGAEVRRQQRGSDEMKIFVRLPLAERGSVADVGRLVLRTRTGGEIPSHEAARIIRHRSYESINRVDGRRVLNVTADIVAGATTADQVLSTLNEKVLQPLRSHYPHLVCSYEGEQRDQREALTDLRRVFSVAMLALFGILVIPFRSYCQAMIVMIAIPFGVVGAVLGHVIMGYGLSMISLLGMVALSGVVINDNILLIDTANNYRRDGMGLEEAAARAPTRRLRPVLLTSLTTFFGLAPMIFETSVQARFLIPMALSLGFGILGSTLISLVLTPSLYLIVEDIKRLCGRGATSGSESSHST